MNRPYAFPAWLRGQAVEVRGFPNAEGDFEAQQFLEPGTERPLNLLPLTADDLEEIQSSWLEYEDEMWENNEWPTDEDDEDDDAPPA